MQLCICIYIYICIYMCIHVEIYVHIHISLSLSLYIYIYIYIHTYIYVHVYAYVYVYIYIYIYIYIWGAVVERAQSTPRRACSQGRSLESSTADRRSYISKRFLTTPRPTTTVPGLPPTPGVVLPREIRARATSVRAYDDRAQALLQGIPLCQRYALWQHREIVDLVNT